MVGRNLSLIKAYVLLIIKPVYQKLFCHLYNLIFHIDYPPKATINRFFFLLLNIYFLYKSGQEHCLHTIKGTTAILLWSVEHGDTCVVNSIIYVLLVAFSGNLCYIVCMTWLDFLACNRVLYSRIYLLLTFLVFFNTTNTYWGPSIFPALL